MFKILLAAFALLAVASATDVYSAFYSNGDCTGAPASSLKITLDQCFNEGTEYLVVAFDGSSYSTGFYSDSACQTTLTTVDANPFTGSAGVCTAYTASSVAKSAKILSGSDYASNSAANYDCTSGTCILITNEPTSAPTVKTAWYTATYSDNLCATVSSSTKFTMGQCTGFSSVYVQDPFSPAFADYCKLTMDESISPAIYSFDIYSDSTCTTKSTYMSPSPITGAADACSAYTLNKGDGDSTGSFKVLSSEEYPENDCAAECSWDCTSGSCVIATNSAAHVSIGILSACLAVMAQWIA